MPLCGVSMLLSFGVGAYLGWWDLRPKGAVFRIQVPVPVRDADVTNPQVPVAPRSEQQSATRRAAADKVILSSSGLARHARPSQYPPTLRGRGAPDRQLQPRFALPCQTRILLPEIDYSLLPPATSRGAELVRGKFHTG
jgi:hypothetical protein